MGGGAFLSYPGATFRAMTGRAGPWPPQPHRSTVRRMADDEGTGRPHVYIRQAVEGRKLEVYLSAAETERLRSGEYVELDDEATDWQDSTETLTTGRDESAQIVSVQIHPHQG